MAAAPIDLLFCFKTFSRVTSIRAPEALQKGQREVGNENRAVTRFERSPDWMAQGDGSSMRIHLGRVQSEKLDVGEANHSEGLIEFVVVDVFGG